MSIIDSSQQQIQLLTQKKDEILSLKYEIPDAPYHIFSINAQIRDAEMRYERLRAGFSAVKCNQCTLPVYEGIHSVNLKGHVICERCLRTISQVMNTTEMEERRSMKTGTVKQDCNNVLHFLQETSIIRKSGKFWLVHEALLELFYDADRSKRHLELSWVEEMETKLEQLRTQHRIVSDIKSTLSGATLQLFSLDAQIQDYENRLRLIKGGTLPFRCTQCSAWIKEAGLPILLGHFTLCKSCKHTIEQVITAGEAETRFDLTTDRIRKDIHRGHLVKYREKGLLRQSGSIWILHESIIKDHYFPEMKPAPAEPPVIPDSLLSRSAAIFQRVQDGR